MKLLSTFAAFASAVLFVTGSLPSAAATAPVTYLAIGDSLAYGMQIGKLQREIAHDAVSAKSFDTGYVDVLAAQLRTTIPNLDVVDFGCPGETTASFLAGPCAYATSGKPFGKSPLPLHDAYAGAQFAATLAYLNDHPEVRTITIDLGINDLRAVELACAAGANFDRCVMDRWTLARPQTEKNLRDIFSRLRRAAPSATIVALGYYNWLAVTAPGTDRTVEDLDTTIAGAAARAKVRFVNPFDAFNRTGNERTRLCELTFFCGVPRDLHPTDAGYRTIGNLLIDALR